MTNESIEKKRKNAKKITVAKPLFIVGLILLFVGLGIWPLLPFGIVMTIWSAIVKKKYKYALEEMRTAAGKSLIPGKLSQAFTLVSYSPHTGIPESEIDNIGIKKKNDNRYEGTSLCNLKLGDMAFRVSNIYTYESIVYDDLDDVGIINEEKKSFKGVMFAFRRKSPVTEPVLYKKGRFKSNLNLTQIESVIPSGLVSELERIDKNLVISTFNYWMYVGYNSKHYIFDPTSDKYDADVSRIRNTAAIVKQYGI